MKKVKITLGLAAVAAAFTLAVATTPNAQANRLWRNEPGETEVQPGQCQQSLNFCANIYNDEGTEFVGVQDGDYQP